MERFDLIVVGAGPAGLSAAIEAAKQGMKVIVFDENHKPGGQLFKQIHKFFGSKEHKAKIRGFNIGTELLKEADTAGVQVKLDATVTGIFENKEVTQESFERSKKKIYGDYTSEYNSVDEIGRMFLQDAVKGYNSIDYLNKLEEIDLEYVNAIRKKLLRNDRHSLSIVKGK